MTELHDELNRLAGLAGAGRVAERMEARVGPMVARVRRRKVARRTGTSLAALGTVAAVGVAFAVGPFPGPLRTGLPVGGSDAASMSGSTASERLPATPTWTCARHRSPTRPSAAS